MTKYAHKYDFRNHNVFLDDVIYHCTSPGTVDAGENRRRDG